jgi:hypothetical protein
MSGRKFTWANNLTTPTYEKLDCILISTEWEEKIPSSTVQMLTRDVSDHTPLLLNSGETIFRNTEPVFKFETGWLLRDGFMDMIRDVWAKTKSGNSPMEQWQGKNQRLRQHLRGWVKNTGVANIKKGRKIF